MFTSRTKNERVDKRLLFIVVILVLIGLVAVSSASVVLSFQRFEKTSFYSEKQLIFALVGIALMIIFSKIDYHLFKRYAFFIMLGSLILLAIVLVPGIGFEVGDSKRWINLGFFLLQPSEFSKIALIIFLSAWFESRREMVKNSFFSLTTPLLVTALTAGLVILEPDFGSTISILLISFSIFFIGETQLMHLFYLVAVGLGLGWMAIQAAPYRLERIFTFLNPNADPLGSGYQIKQSLIAVGSGGLWGMGFGESRQKFNFLPEPMNDSIFAVLSEEFGFAKVALILGLFLAFILLGLNVARKAPDSFGRNLAAGLTMWVMIQLVVNVGAILNILPLTGITLPFISYGGSSLIMLLSGAGILLNISKNRV